MSNDLCSALQSKIYQRVPKLSRLHMLLTITLAILDTDPQGFTLKNNGAGWFGGLYAWKPGGMELFEFNI
jgi:hypothetical protein